MFRYVLIVLAAFLYSNSVTASLLTPITDPGTGAKVYVPSGSGLGQKRTFTSNVNIGSGTAKVPTTLVKNFGWARVGTAVRTIAKGSPQAIVGTVALGWLINQIPGAEVDPSGAFTKLPGPTNTTITFWSRAFSPPYRGGSALEACRGGGSTNYLSTFQQTPTSVQCHNPYNGWLGNVTLTTLSCPNGNTGYYCNDKPLAAVPFTDADFDQLAANTPNIPADMWSDFGPSLDAVPGTFDGPPDTVDFTGPPSIDLPSTTTTSTNPTTGDTTVTQSLPSVNFTYGSNPLSVTATPTTTTTTYQNGTVTNTTTTTTNNTTNSNVTVTPASTEVPTDCAFMPTVCEFIEWVKTPFTPDEVDFSQFTEDKDFKESVTISGNATCPAPMIINTKFDDYEFSWEPACQWAGLLKPILMIGALIAAIYISLGIGRSD